MSEVKQCQYCNQPANQGLHFHGNTVVNYDAAIHIAITWTTEAPTKPAWYWWRNQYGQTRVLQVMSVDGGLLVDDDSSFIGEWRAMSRMTGEWSNLPLDLPKERT